MQGYAKLNNNTDQNLSKHMKNNINKSYSSNSNLRFRIN